MEQEVSFEQQEWAKGLRWVAEPPVDEGLLAEVRWFGGYSLHHTSSSNRGCVGLAPHCPHIAVPPSLPSRPKAEAHYRWNGLIRQHDGRDVPDLFWFGDWERENASSLLFLRARPSSLEEEGGVAGWKYERLFELPRLERGSRRSPSPAHPHPTQEEDDDEEECSAVVLTPAAESRHQGVAAVVVGSDGLGHLFVAEVGQRGAEAKQGPVAGQLLVYEDLVSTLSSSSSSSSPEALVPRPFVITAAAFLPGGQGLLALAYYMTGASPAEPHRHLRQCHHHHHMVLLSVQLASQGHSKVSVVQRLTGLHRPYRSFFVPDAKGAPSSFVVLSEGVFGPSLEAATRFMPRRPSVSPLVRLPEDNKGQQQKGHGLVEESLLPSIPAKDWSEMSMQEMAEAINARLAMENEDVDFDSPEYYDEEVAGVRSARGGAGAASSTNTWGIYRYCCSRSSGGENPYTVRLVHLQSLGAFPVTGFEDISPTEKYILVKCDVDSLVYKLSFDLAGESEPSMSLAHVDVFGGLAYIEAGKRHKKATLLSPTRSHAVILEGSRFIYVYHHAAPGAAKSDHHIIEDPSGEDVLGWQFVDTRRLAFLTKSKLEVHALTP